MTSSTETAKPCPIGMIGTTLGRARCRQPARIARMKQSLAAYGQLTPLVVVPSRDGVELVDGFKRLAAATTLGWPTMIVAVTPLDETGQWATMLLLNRGPSSMTALEEGLVLREMRQDGADADRDRGAVLAPQDLGESTDRPGGPAASGAGGVDEAGHAAPGVGATAALVASGQPARSWRRWSEARGSGRGTRSFSWGCGAGRRSPKARRALLFEPRSSLSKHHPETRRSPLDPRLWPEGQRLVSVPAPLRGGGDGRRAGGSGRRCATTDRAILDEVLRTRQKAVSRLATELGSARTVAGERESGKGGRDELIKKLKGDGQANRPSRASSGSTPRTVRRSLRRALRRERTKRPSKLDPFKPLIHKLVLADELSCVRVLEEIRAVGYDGGDFILKAYVRTFRPKTSRRPHLRFETEPGVQGQVDLSPYTVLLVGRAHARRVLLLRARLQPLALHPLRASTPTCTASATATSSPSRTPAVCRTRSSTTA